MSMAYMPSPYTLEGDDYITSQPSLISSPPTTPLDASPRSLKRKRSAPLTPPLTANDPEGLKTLAKATRVLSTEAAALSFVSVLYQTDPVARDGLLRAVDCVSRRAELGGKLIICGVGKSGLVGMKTVATMKSLGIPCSFMHAAEAVHGDLGDVRPNDAVMFISFSGRTSELLNILPHLAPSTPVLALTSHLNPSTCPLLSDRPSSTSILLPAPIHEAEEASFGVCAPTTSTTVAIAIGDMLALSVADRLHALRTKEVFQRHHPGGAIGESAKRRKTKTTMGDVAVKIEDIPIVIPSAESGRLTALDVMRTALSSVSGWVRIAKTPARFITPRDLQRLRRDEDISELECTLDEAESDIFEASDSLEEAESMAKSGGLSRIVLVKSASKDGESSALIDCKDLQEGTYKS